MEPHEEGMLEEARSILDSTAKESKLGDDYLICECVCISVGDIRELLLDKKVNLDLETLKRKLQLGSGCSSCTKTFKTWKEQI